MRAVVITDISNRSVAIADVPDPVPGDDEILVDVKACGINFTDLLSLDGKYQNNPPPPFTPGKDSAGIVEAGGARLCLEDGVGIMLIELQIAARNRPDQHHECHQVILDSYWGQSGLPYARARYLHTILSRIQCFLCSWLLHVL